MIRRRWWVAPIAVGLVAIAIVIRVLTAPLEVNANLSDGDRSVPRVAAIDLRFNQDMKAESVHSAFSIQPSVPVTFKAVSPTDFQFWPKMEPDTNYHVRLENAEAASGRSHVSRAFSFKTEPAPTVSAVNVDSATLTNGQQGVPPKGEVKLTFSQVMDSARTPILLNGKPFEAARIKWAADGKTVGLDLKLSHSRTYELSVPQAAVNKKQDPFAAEWKFNFGTVVQVPSAGVPERIGSGAPVLIQIDNLDEARPQAGMQQADMIYEYISEGSVPRLTAVYWHPLPNPVGPVRSCRLITIRLEQMYKGMIYCSGANDYILGKVWENPNLVNDYSRGAGGVFYRDNSTRYAPHNVMMNGGNTTAFTASKNLAAPGYEIAPKHPDSPATGDPAPRIDVPDHQSSWRYDAASKQYLKTQDGRPFMNVGTGQVHARTVIVEYVKSFLDLNPANSFHGYYTEAYELTGEGKADIFKDGMVIHATWHHPDPNVPATYLDANGDPVELDNGLTWVHVLGSEKWHML
jgi:hypothetical protein